MQAFTRLSLIYSSSTLGTTGKLSIIYVVAPSLLQHKKKKCASASDRLAAAGMVCKRRNELVKDTQVWFVVPDDVKGAKESKPPGHRSQRIRCFDVGRIGDRRNTTVVAFTFISRNGGSSSYQHIQMN